MVGVALLFLMFALRHTLAAEAHICWFVQEPDPGGVSRYRWRLSGAPGQDPCECAAFRLGGVNTEAFSPVPGLPPVHAVVVNRSRVAKSRKELRDIFGCQPEHTRCTTSPGEGPALFTFSGALRIAFVTVNGTANVKLSVGGNEYGSYKIDFGPTEVRISMSYMKRNYQPIATATPGQIQPGQTELQFTLSYEVHNEGTQYPKAVIEVGLNSEPVTSTEFYLMGGTVIDTVSLSSTETTEWDFQNSEADYIGK